jgi:hypothetical protein
VDLNLPNPYDMIEENELDYSFYTKDGIMYRAYFLSAAHLHNSFLDAYSFSIEPVGEEGNTKHPIDVRISITIASILRDFFRKNENSMLMVCDNIDGKEEKRKKLFERWYHIYNNHSLIKLDASLENEDYRLFVSMFINRNNPKREILIRAFNELVRTDLYELGI